VVRPIGHGEVGEGGREGASAELFPLLKECFHVGASALWALDRFNA
jgi:hypothetical protein